MRPWSVAAAAALALAPAAVARAAAGDEELFDKGARALERGEYAVAIDTFEALSDRGFVHPDASFDRGLSYATRVRERAEREGDLGRAAAAFEEVLELRPGDAEAEEALATVRAEITRRRSKRAKAEILASPSFDRQVVGLLSVRSWGVLCLVASGLLALGIFLRAVVKEGVVHVAGSVLAPAALLLLAGVLPGALWADHLRRATRPGVVVVPEAHLEDDDGKPIKPDRAKKDQASSVPEGARVEILDRRSGKARVRWGTNEGWIASASVRPLATR